MTAQTEAELKKALALWLGMLTLVYTFKKSRGSNARRAKHAA